VAYLITVVYSYTVVVPTDLQPMRNYQKHRQHIAPSGIH